MYIVNLHPDKSLLFRMCKNIILSLKNNIRTFDMKFNCINLFSVKQCYQVKLLTKKNYYYEYAFRGFKKIL